ncbi:MAG: haloacid dehalogenase type II [Alphaproteobacteria bacterium]|nr:haloacid dehalogenase type II [Alphaproteobacteria bacterium]
MSLGQVKALTFDVFGTVVDWRSSVIRELRQFGAAKGIDADWEAFADSWRGLYQPSMERVRRGERAWVRLDTLHRESLLTLLDRHKIAGLGEAEIDRLVRAWHRLDPWPDVVAGLNRLKPRYILATMSNGNTSLMVNLARYGRLPWDAILGAEPAQGYKPEPKVYLAGADWLGLEPEECMLVAAHNGDLVAAAGTGFKTGFVARPTEHGPHQKIDFKAEHDFDVIAADFGDLARRMGC